MDKELDYYSGDQAQTANYRQKTYYFRSTVRIHNDLVLTFIEDGKINLKRSKDTLTLDEQEMNYVLQLAQILRDYKTAQKKLELDSLDVRQKSLDEQRLIINERAEA